MLGEREREEEERWWSSCTRRKKRGSRGFHDGEKKEDEGLYLKKKGSAD